MASNPVPQQADGHIRTEILLNRAHHVQGSPSEDAHHGGPVARAQAVLDALISASGQVLADALQWHCVQAGIARCTPHGRTCLSNLLAAGVDPFLVQRLAGHADPATTALYDRRHDAVDRMPDPTTG